MCSFSFDFYFYLFGLLCGMKLHYVLKGECYCPYGKMSPRTRAQGKGITSLDALDEGFAKPSPTTPQDRGRGT